MPQETASAPVIAPLAEVPARTPAGEKARALRLSGHVPVLDGLRGIAIALVLLRHFTPGGEAHSTIGSIVKAVASVGNTGVDLFFVLSGFLITGILADAKGSAHYFRNFYARRTLRIFPLYYGVLVVCFLIIPLIHPLGPAEQAVAHRQGWLWLYGTNIRESFTDANFPFSGGWIFMDHFWSLAVEEHFYLVWPLVIWMCSRRGAIVACFVFIATAFAWRLGLHIRSVESMAYYQLTTCRMDALALGGLLALVARESSDTQWAGRAALIAMPVSFVALLVVWRTDWQEELFGGSLLAILFASLLIVVLTSRETNPIVRVLNARGLRLMGKYSYATYVLHPFLFATLMKAVAYEKLKVWTHSGLIGVCLFVVIGFTSSIALGWLSWHVYEKHFLKLKRFFEYRKPV